MDTLLNMENRHSLPILITVSLSCIIYTLIVRRFVNDPNNVPGIDTIITRLTPEESLNILHQMGLDFLTYSGPFFTLIWLYLWNVQNLVEVIDLDLATVDLDVLRHMMQTLKFLIINHELIFGVIGRICDMDEDLQLAFEFDIEDFHTLIREIGNNLYRLYRQIEFELDIQHSDLPDN
jgi:hypothetical protein